MSLWIKKALIGLLWLTACSTTQAALLLGSSDHPVALAGHLSALVDAPQSAPIEAVAAGKAGAFHPLGGNYIGGFGKERSIWLRFTLQSTAPQTESWLLRVLPTYLDHVDLYSPTPNGWSVTRGGDTRPFDTRAIDDRAVVFSLNLAPNEPRTFYLHLRHAGAFNAYPTLYPPTQYQRQLSLENLWLGAFFGVAVLLLLIHVVYWVTLREWVFLAFGVYVAIRIVYFFTYDGLTYQWLLPDQPELVHTALRFSLAWVVATIAPILVQVLDMRRHHPHLARIVWALGGFAAIFSITVFTGQFAEFGGLLSLIVLLLGTIGAGVAALQWRQNRPLGTLILLAMIIMLIGLAVSALASLRHSSGALWDLYGGQIASLATLLAIHFAVTQRVVLIKREKIISEQAVRLANERTAQERAARQEQADFFAMLFHEIKTPLAEIASATTVLEQLDDGGKQETGSRYDTIHHAVERLNLMVEQNLARDRLGLEEIHLARQEVDLAELVRSVLDAFRMAHPQRVLIDSPTDIPTVQGDPEFLRVALANLIDNAIKYSPANGDIRVCLSAEPTRVTLSVQDQGAGMSAEAVARAFDRYWRGDAAGTISGTGLGLYLVRRIAQAHGGDVSIESAPGQGSRFTLSLPLASA